MTVILEGANTTAQWYQDDYPTASFQFLEKLCLHSTETLGWPGYGGGASAPNATTHLRAGQTRQHFGADRSSRALRDPSATDVRENRDRVFQLEIVAYSDRNLARKYGGLWVGDMTDAHYLQIADIAIDLNRKMLLPLRSTVRWSPTGTGVRLSGPEYDRYQGILAHMHVSGNFHWDTGALSWDRLEEAIDTRQGSAPPPEEPSWEDYDMYVTKRGRNVWLLFWAGKIVPISEDAYETFIRAGIPHETLDNADIDALRAFYPAS